MSEALRVLNERFMADLKPGGILCEVVSIVNRDMTLDFQIRSDEVHIYYRGGRVLVIEQKNHGYRASFNRKYCKGHRYAERLSKLPASLKTAEDVLTWIDAFPLIKQAIDEHRGKNEKLEREYQQHVVRENNNAAMEVALRSDYFIVDIEYDNVGRCDMVAFKWQTGHRQRPGEKVRLALIEMKFGDKSLTGKSGLKQHVKDVEMLLGDAEKKERFVDEMICLFRQKRDLGVIRSLQGAKEGVIYNTHEIEKISDEKPEFILVHAAHSPNSDTLLKVLNEMEAGEEPQLPMKHVDLKIAVANFMGYSLYAKCMYDLKTFRETFSKQIFGKEKRS